jgi:hypothetical protein
MTYEEAVAWLKGQRSTANIIQSDSNSNGQWIVQTAQADAAMTQQAYWIVKAWSENIVPSVPESGVQQQ